MSLLVHVCELRHEYKQMRGQMELGVGKKEQYKRIIESISFVLETMHWLKCGLGCVLLFVVMGETSSSTVSFFAGSQSVEESQRDILEETKKGRSATNKVLSWHWNVGLI